MIEDILKELINEDLARSKERRLDLFLNDSFVDFFDYISGMDCENGIISDFFYDKRIGDFLGLRKLDLFHGSGFYSRKYDICIFFNYGSDEMYDLSDKLLYQNYPELSFSDVLSYDENFDESLEILEGGKDFYFIEWLEGGRTDKFKLHELGLFAFFNEFSIVSPETITRLSKAYREYSDERDSISKKSLKDFVGEPEYKSLLLKRVFTSVSPKYSDHEVKLVFDYLLECDFSDYIIRAFNTYVYCSKKSPYDSAAFDYLDLTFIVVSLFKLVETMFCRFVNLKWHDKVITPLHGKNRRPIYLSDEDLSLGSLNKIFDCNDRDINDFLYKRQKYADDLYIVLDRFINCSRNGFLHKDAIEDSENLDVSIDDSLNSIFLLVLLFR